MKNHIFKINQLQKEGDHIMTHYHGALLTKAMRDRYETINYKLKTYPSSAKYWMTTRRAYLNNNRPGIMDTTRFIETTRNCFPNLTLETVPFNDKEKLIAIMDNKVNIFIELERRKMKYDAARDYLANNGESVRSTDKDKLDKYYNKVLEMIL